nr:immunoglobulin heavy chain junction region [Macaca mulatta]MOW88259.1 immunoglobulin heavy chain junction region [Macaca mulatta]MOW89604.1 immunoglobulin heavy chain junction region [Macaca mulatta]MOW92583.1 immunoglobulin heavy chain junction region [Macaca mulatta]
CARDESAISITFEFW